MGWGGMGWDEMGWDRIEQKAPQCMEVNKGIIL
jgi:hypothetical protein